MIFYEKKGDDIIENISIKTLQRLPIYLDYLKTIKSKKIEKISAKKIANEFGFGEIQVRKDLASVSSKGKPKVGYIVKDLIEDLEKYLGYKEVNNAIIVGAGRLGKALLLYEGFSNYGLNILAAFDINNKIVDTIEDRKKILPLSKLNSLCKITRVHIGIITVPSNCAQSVCNMLIDNGILAIWNFAPKHLKVPSGIIIKNENMASSLAVLSNRLNKKLIN